MSSSKNKVFKYIVAILFTIIFLLPVLYIILSAFKTKEELLVEIIPKTWTLSNFKEAFQTDNFLTSVVNSLFVAVVSTIVMVAINTMAGYALAKFKFKGATIIFIIILSTIMLPLEVIMVPIFDMLKLTGLYNNIWALIIPPAAAPTGVFIMKQFLTTIPDELMQSARIDGAGEWRIFLQIILPNARPAIATLAIFSFMWRWNDYIWPLIAIRDESKYTLQLVISNLSGQYTTDWSVRLAIAAISMIPMLIIFLIFQKQFVQGTATTGMKG